MGTAARLDKPKRPQAPTVASACGLPELLSNSREDRSMMSDDTKISITETLKPPVEWVSRGSFSGGFRDGHCSLCQFEGIVFRVDSDEAYPDKQICLPCIEALYRGEVPPPRPAPKSDASLSIVGVLGLVAAAIIVGVGSVSYATPNAWEWLTKPAPEPIILRLEGELGRVKSDSPHRQGGEARPIHRESAMTVNQQARASDMRA